eukprot:gene19104-21730_t
MQKLPARIAKNLVTLKNVRGQMVHLLGTAHVSQQSCNDARTVISTIKPSAVFLELCKQREQILDPSFDYNGASKLSVRQTLEAYRSGNLNGFTLMYTLMTKYHNLEPGKEFIAAADEAAKFNIPIVLGDRSVGITIKRIWQGLTFWQKAKLVKHFLSSHEDGISIEEDDMNALIDNRQAIMREMDRLAKVSPWLVECLLHERDKFMVLELEQTLDELKEGNIVAVVGAAHVMGMEKFWNERASMEHNDEFNKNSDELHYQLQKYPGMPHETFTEADLRKYAANFSVYKPMLFQ